MKLFSRLFEHRYCAFCKSPRRVYAKKHIDLTNVLASSALSGVVSVAFYGQLDPRALLFFCLVTALGESFIYFRWRLSLVCRLCGFDPVVYKRSPAAAAARVRAFFEEQIANPKFQLSKSPLLELHRQQRIRERKNLERRLALERKKSQVLASEPRSPVVAPKGPVVRLGHERPRNNSNL